MTIKQIPRGHPFTEDGILSYRAREVLQLLIELDILEGAGSPEGVVVAKSRRLYMDTSGTAGSILYIKKLSDISGNRANGWILV